jgi:transglutaminase-like putative cysteine protease
MTRKRLTALPPRLPVAVRELSDELRRSGAAEGSIATRADEATRWLQRNRRYMLPGQEGFARNLGDFLLGGGAGHCEYFATALTLLLRQQDIPCRLVGGYLAREWDDAAQEVVVRGRHAHAWVEVLDERGAWLTFDPTPPAELGDGAAADGLFAHIRDALESAWASVTGFNATSRGEAFAALGRAARDHGWLVGLAAAAIAGLAALARAGRQPATVRQLRRAMRRSGLRLAPGETPRELLARALACGVPAPRRERLAAAVAAHDAARYAAPAR